MSATSLLAALLWDISALDLPAAHLFGSAGGFPLRNAWLTTNVLHDAARWVSWALLTALVALCVVPVGPFGRLPLARRLQIPITALVATALIATLKSMSGASCPWDVTDFGGVAEHISHWNVWGHSDKASQHCFPAGHASSGFAFAGGWFALRRHLPGHAKWWLAGSMAAGLVLGVSQQARGAHFASHTLWTAWICWVCAGALDHLVEHRFLRLSNTMRRGAA